MDTQGRLNQANGRLRAAKVGVIIEARGNRLYLRSTFPPKPNSGKSQSHQQRLALSIHFNIAGISRAETQARKIGALIDCKEFSWEPYLKLPQSLPQSLIKDWVARFEQNYFERRARTPAAETTWKLDYWEVFKRLPLDEQLTQQVLRTAILGTSPDTKTRRRFCLALQSLAKFAELEFDAKPMMGAYCPKRVRPRDLPEDAAIANWFSEIPNDTWRWVYGILATYGLRPHEVFHLDTTDLVAGGVVLSVLEGKTGPRRVWPCYPEWVDTFNLRAPVLPDVNVDSKSNSDLGHGCSQYFRRAGVPFRPYDLRHCWAVRSLSYGLDISLAAQQMGHSVRIHTDLYHHWISDRLHQRAFEALMQRSDRPKAPTHQD